MFFNKKNPNYDEYDSIISSINTSYNNFKIDSSRFSSFRFFQTLAEFESFAYSLATYYDVEIELNYVEEINEIEFNLPRLFVWKEIETENKIKHSIGITPFGVQQLELLVCEFILLMTEIKVSSDGFIAFDQEYLDDYERLIRPYLFHVAIYFGLGEFFIVRYWISGSYHMKSSDEDLSFKYHVPLHKDELCYAHTMFLISNELEMDFNKFELDPSLKKEIKKASNYIQKGKSNYYNYLKMNRSSNFKWNW